MQHVFVSYSHKDNDFAQLLRTELQNAGVQTWLALENIKAGEDWKSEIDDAIKNSFALIVIISQASDQSKYVTYEWALAYGFGIPIIPILYKRLEPPQKPHPRLESLQYEDFTTNINRPWHRIINRLNEIQAQYLQKEQRDPKIEEAIQALDHWDSATIVRAADMLGRRKIQSAISKLDRLLDEPDSIIQNAAIRALGDIGSTNEVSKIINLVDKAETRFSAIESLGKLGDTKAEAAILRYIDTEDNDLKILCIKALKNIQASALKDVLLGVLQRTSSMWDEDLDEQGWGDENVLEAVFDALADRVTKDDVPSLIEILGNYYPNINARIVKLLGELRDKRALLQLLKFTGHESHFVRASAHSALEKFEEVKDFQEKLKFLSSKQQAERKVAIDFFYQYFGLEGLLYILEINDNNAYWQISNKIENVYKDSDLKHIRAALHASSGRVRGLIADVIRRKKLTELCGDLQALIDDDSDFARGLAIRAIGDLGCAKSITRLKKRLKDTSHIFNNSTLEIRDFAAIALGKLGRKDALPRLQELVFDKRVDLQNEAIALFVSLEGVIDKKQLESEFYGSDAARRTTALKILAQSEKKIDITELTRSLSSEDRNERQNAINELSELYPPLGLIIAFTFNDVEVQSYWDIAEKLRNILQLEHLSLISQFLSDDNYLVRAFLAEVLGHRPDLDLSEYLVRLVDDNVAFVRGLATRAIGRLRVSSAKEVLLTHLNDKEKVFSNSTDRVCDYALLALVNIERRISVEVLDILKSNPSEISETLIEMNQSSPLLVEDEFANELSSLLIDHAADNNLSAAVVNLIGEFGSSKDAHVLLDHFASGHGEWFQIARIVRLIADKTITPKALRLLDIKNSDLRKACLDILTDYGDNTVIDKVSSLLDEEEDPYVVFRAINVLAAYGDVSLLDKISSFRDSEEDSIRASVVRAYGKLRDEYSLTRIMPFLDDQAYVVRAAAVRALIDLENSANLLIILEHMNIWANENDDYFKWLYDMACLEAIGKFGKDEHLPLLREAALKHKDPDCRAAAIYALKALNDEKIVDLLIIKLSDRHFAGEYGDGVCNIAARILNTVNEKKAKDALEEWLSNLPEDERQDFGTIDANHLTR